MFNTSQMDAKLLRYPIKLSPHLPLLGALPREFGEIHALSGVLLLVLFTASLHEVSVRGHLAPWLSVFLSHDLLNGHFQHQTLQKINKTKLRKNIDNLKQNFFKLPRKPIDGTEKHSMLRNKKFKNSKNNFKSQKSPCKYTK